MWPEKVAKHSKGQESKESPMCVASMATQFLPGDVPSLKLNSPRNEDAPNEAASQSSKRNPSPQDVNMDASIDDDRFAPLLKLQGTSLVRCPACPCLPSLVCFLLLRTAAHTRTRTHTHIHTHTAPNHTHTRTAAHELLSAWRGRTVRVSNQLLSD
jgi:hypothetical protein